MDGSQGVDVAMFTTGCDARSPLASPLGRRLEEAAASSPQLLETLLRVGRRLGFTSLQDAAPTLSVTHP
ncbi:hypothetical protein [Nostoc sp.]|uniref:hypothetical protein n=1 Tax=Nostoc sp. TaxID=1180 RepID=UPI002FFCA613